MQAVTDLYDSLAESKQHAALVQHTCHRNCTISSASISQVHYGKQSVLLQAVAVDVRGLADSLKALVESGMHKAAGMLMSSNHTAVLPACPDHSSHYKHTMS